MKHKYLLSILLLSTSLLALKGQTLDDARSWYLEERYAEALPLFQKAHAEDSTDAALNQWLGVSLLKTGRILEAEKHLSYADEKRIPEATLYLGELYSKLYRFDDAEKAFEKYQKAHRRNKEALAKLDRFREEAALLQRRALRTEDVQIIDSLVLTKREFLSAYNLSPSSGSLQPINTLFAELPVDNETLYLNERGDKVYYSKEGARSGHDLFTMDKLIDHFGNEQRLPDNINGEGHQAYPFVMSDGLTLYYASTGQQSLGGYDLFVTRYNLESDSYLTPSQLNMPFNSPFNDYMMAIDEEKGIGWFASDRFQPEGFVCIYTFLPNSQVTMVESDDQSYIYRRARIASISDTWREGVDYSPLLTVARQRSTKEDAATSEFIFIINDEKIYHRLDDFTSSRARNQFSQALKLEKQLKLLESKLKENRDQIAVGGEASSSLTTMILEQERECEILYQEIEQLKKEARNEEIRNLTS